jgi:methylenetetrahydrofolate dehydrogenase (NADP+) / methenyltetrahydrofolate cyclohydrolase
MGRIIKGKPVADEITNNLICEVKKLKLKDINPKLAVVRVGENEGAISYERGILNRFSRIGIDVQVEKLPEDISEKSFISTIEKMNVDDSINGIMVFRPLPKQLNENTIKYVIDPKKDVDCFNPINMSKILENDISGFLPCTPAAVISILNYYKIEVSGKKVVVIGRSMVVGKPLSLLLLNKNATITICHSKTKNLQSEVSKADIVIACIGKAKMIDSSYIKDGAVIIDVGINTDESGNLCGDVDTEDCMKSCEMITPVPGGVGSVTTSILAQQLIKACKFQNNFNGF